MEERGHDQGASKTYSECRANQQIKLAAVNKAMVKQSSSSEYGSEFESEDDCKDSRKLAKKEGGEPVDLLELCLKYRDELGWNQTILKELYAFVSFAVAYPN